MSITPDFLQQLKSRHTLSLIIGTRVKLKRQGRHLSGLCPFHQEKSPSFTVHDSQGHYHCFGCGAHGDVITFLQEIERLTFVEAVEKLASLAGLEMPVSSFSSLPSVAPRKDLFKLMEEAARFFQYVLRSDRGRDIRRYLEERQIQPQFYKNFQLGYAPEENALKNHFLKLGYSETTLVETGLLSQREDKTQTYDRFRDRLMFPIWDRQGRVVAFGGRARQGTEPKYLNSPETTLFHKGSLLYAYHLARKPAHTAKRVILCEGYMDVIALHQGGITEAVAPLGTALTEEQMTLLWQLHPQPYVCFDGDTAGQKAAWRTVERILPLLKPGHSLQFAPMPEGEDPDSLIKIKGREGFEQLLSYAIPLDKMIWHHFLNVNPLKTPEDRAKLEKDLMDTAQTIQDYNLRNIYRQTFRTRLFEHFKIQKKSNARPAFSTALGPMKPIYNALFIQHKILCAGILNYPSLLQDHYELFLEIDLPDSLIRLKDHILIQITENPSLEACHLQKILYNDGFAEILDSLLSEDLYRHATFIRSGTPYEEVQKGWLEIYRHVQNIKKAQDLLNQPLSPGQSSLSPLLRAMVKHDFITD